MSRRTAETVEELREWILARLRDLARRHPPTSADRYMSADDILAFCKRTIGDHIDEATVDLQIAMLVRRKLVVKEAAVYSAAEEPSS